ncbi:MAG: hypothetical protein ACPGUV_01920 [Polyangiales bacterium]
MITHLFADGGRILASLKTDYREHLDARDFATIVRALMREQHKAMFIALRDGVYDEVEEETTSPRVQVQTATEAAKPVERPTEAVADLVPAITTAAQHEAQQAPAATARRSAPLASSTAAAEVANVPLQSNAPRGFGDDLISEKSLDELILGYLADDLG